MWLGGQEVRTAETKRVCVSLGSPELEHGSPYINCWGSLVYLASIHRLPRTSSSTVLHFLTYALTKCNAFSLRQFWVPPPRASPMHPAYP